MTKDSLKIQIRAKSPIATKLSHFNCQGGHVHLEVTWEWHFGSKLKIYVETIYCEYFVFYQKKILLVIFQTLFTENCQFFKDFDKNLFLPKL